MSDEVEYAKCFGCNVCQGCDSCEAFCQHEQVAAKNCRETIKFNCGHGNCYENEGEPKKDSYMISATSWEAFIDWIAKKYNDGSAFTTGCRSPKTFNASGIKNKEFVTAEAFNEVRKGLKQHGNESYITSPDAVAGKTIIYGSYFKNLEEFANNYFLYHEGQCESCVNCLGADSCGAICQVQCLYGVTTTCDDGDDD